MPKKKKEKNINIKKVDKENNKNKVSSNSKKTKKKKPKIRIRKRRFRKVKDEIKHIYIPKHEVLDEEEQEEVLSKLNISEEQLPLISIKDPGIRHLEVKEGAIIKITRENPIIGKTFYYRKVVRL
jgi:DNA-directed RNA polymerase subunit H